MRAAQVRALSWELIARNRAGLLLTLLGVPLLLSSAQSVASFYPELARWLGTINLISVWSVIYLVMVFTYADFSARMLETGFPSHALLLPVPTWLLVAVPLGFATAMVYGYSLLLLNIILEVTLSAADYAYLLLGALIIMAWIQMISWGLSRTPIRAALILIVILAVFAVALLSALSIVPVELVGQPVALAILAGLAICGSVLAYQSVVRTRCGQRIGQMLLWSNFTIPGSDRLQVSAMVLSMFVYFSATIGFEISKPNFGAKEFQMTSFWATRPLSNAELAFAKLKLAGLSVGLGALICIFPLYPAWLLAGYEQKMSDGWQALVTRHGQTQSIGILLLAVMLLPVGGWILCANALSLSLTENTAIRNRFIVISLVVITVLGYTAYRVINSAQLQQMLLEHAVFVVLAGALAIASLLTWLVRRFAAQFNLRLLRQPFGVAVVITLPVLAAVWSLTLESRLTWTITLLIANLALLSLLPVVAAPIAVAINRHR